MANFNRIYTFRRASIFYEDIAQQIKRSIQKINSDKLLDFKVNKYDREYLPIAIGIGKENH